MYQFNSFSDMSQAVQVVYLSNPRYNNASLTAAIYCRCPLKVWLYFNPIHATGGCAWSIIVVK
jgi:hypothetical protein